MNYSDATPIHPGPVPDPHGPGDEEVVKLADIAGPVREALKFYDAFLANLDPPIGQLDQAIAAIKGLPPVSGRLGRDLDLIASGGEGADRTEIVASLERLRRVAAFNPAETPDPLATVPRRRRTGPSPNQSALPGLG